MLLINLGEFVGIGLCILILTITLTNYNPYPNLTLTITYILTYALDNRCQRGLAHEVVGGRLDKPLLVYPGGLTCFNFLYIRTLTDKTLIPARCWSIC